MQTWIVEPEHANSRLDQYLSQKLEDISRSAIQKRIKSGDVTVNGQAATVHRFLKTEDEIVLREQDTDPIRSFFKDEIVERTTTELQTPRIIEETADWLVIDKPTGLLVHPDTTTRHPTLVDWLLEHDPKIGKIGEDPDRPGIVHRLDREVSGLMVIAKTADAYDSLKAQFAHHETEKTYIALVHGEMEAEEGDIKFRIARSASKARMAARPSHENEGRAAWTHYRVIERFIGATFVELSIFSGRTHQIRAHLHALRHPVIGDALYTLKKPKRNILAPRMMLQSIRLTFRDVQTDEKKTFSIDPDPAFGELMQQFRTS